MSAKKTQFQVTVNDLLIADRHLQVEMTAFGVFDSPRINALRGKLNVVTKRHFKNQPFSKVRDRVVPSAAVTIFNQMCDIAERTCYGYIPPRFID